MLKIKQTMNWFFEKLRLTETYPTEEKEGGDTN